MNPSLPLWSSYSNGKKMHVKRGPKRVSITFAQESQIETDNFWLLQLKALQKDGNRTGPIVQKEKVGTSMIGGNLTMAENAFFIPTDKIRIPMA